MKVCQGGFGHGYANGGTTFGDTYMAGRGQDKVTPQKIKHEKVHRSQWRNGGYGFAYDYIRSGSNAYTNKYERAAGLCDGGYRKGQNCK